MDETTRVLIVGGGLAAAHVARNLRDGGFTGPLVVASEEGEAPYDRPPLSKAVLAGSGEVRTLLSEESALKAAIDLRLNARAVRLDLDERRVEFADGTGERFDRLVVATGARPRPFSVLDGSAVTTTLRTAQDSRWLAGRLGSGRHIVVVGAGFIGLEVAATARASGADVTVLEAAPAPLERAIGSDLAQWLIERHREHGVDIRCGLTVEGWRPLGSAVTLELSDGTTLDADTVVVGVGIERDLDWLAAAGLAVHAGLVVDSDGRTSHPDVWGVGDITCAHSADSCTASQHWTSTTDQAARVAEVMTGGEVGPAPAESYVWSDQYDLTIQLVGTTTGAVAKLIEVLPDGFLAEYYDNDRMVGAAAVNRPREILRRRIGLRRDA